MSSKTDMLGDAVRKLVALPEEHLGVACDLLEKLQDPVWVEAQKKCLRKENPWPMTANFIRDMTKEGWILLENVPETPPISVANLELVEFLKDWENRVGGEEMAKRSINLHANLGQRQAEYILEHQDEIPEEFRKYILVFPGTVWRDRVGDCRVPYLCWGDERWYLLFLWLERGFRSRYRLLRSRE